MKETYKVLLPQDIMDEGKAYLRERGYEIKMGSGLNPEDLKKDIVDCDAIIVRTAKISADVLESATKLKVISQHGVGVDHIDVAKATGLGIHVAHTREANSNTVAEYVLGMIIALGRNFKGSDRATRNGDWDFRNRFVGMDLVGKKLGVIGLGKIGLLVAQKAYYGLSMEILGFDPFLKEEACPEYIKRIEERDEVLRDSDFVTIHVPLSDITRNSIGTHEFNLMKQGAYFINASRGEVVDESALIETLKSNRIAGVALDVFAEEPPRKDNPLFTFDNVLTTTHIAALTKECKTRMAVQAAQGVDEVLSGKSPTWPINSPETPRIK